MKTLCVFLIIACGSASAGIYRWTDENGDVHYSDRPINPENATELSIDTDTRTGVTNSTGNKRERELVLEELEEERQARKEKREKKRLDDRKRREDCARAKDNLRRYQSAGAVYKLNKKGERVFYSNEEREAREDKFRKLIKKHCR